MNRSMYFEYIEEKLNTLATRINVKGKLNILNLHNHSEDFYLHLFNRVFSYDLVNLNANLQNVEAIDLLDRKNKIFIQVSAKATKEKIEDSLKKDSLKNYSGYNFHFISISKEASDLRNKKYINPHSINFSPSVDIHDTTSILNKIKSMNIDESKLIYELIRKELGSEIDTLKLESNLASIIDVLSKEDWDIQEGINKIDKFEIDRKITINNLESVRLVIDDYSIHYHRVDRIYSEFNLQGKNKSSSVLGTIRKEYISNQSKENDTELFLKVIEAVMDKALNSKNFQPIPIDELELCINILVVDAFIRCKIFKNPENYKYASA
jgi:hypothetical protein